MADNEIKPRPHWIVRLFMGLTFAGLMATLITYILPVLMGSWDGGYTRTAAITVTVVCLVGVLVSSAVLKQSRPKE